MSNDGPQAGASGAVEAVIVNWNAGAWLNRCLDSLFAHHPELELYAVVVDNASSDGSWAAVEGRERVRLIVNDTNRGFAAAANQGLKSLRPETAYVLLLNPDVEFTAGVLNPLLEFLDRNPGVGLVTPRIERPDGSFQHTCRRREPTPWQILSHLSGLAKIFPKSDFFAGYFYGAADPSAALEVEAVSGSFMLMRRELLAGAGVFDERYFMYAEDLEFCRRVRGSGREIWYYPATGAVHHGAVSSSQRRLRSVWHKHCTACQYLNSARRQDIVAPVRWLLCLILILLVPFRAVISLFTGHSRS